MTSLPPGPCCAIGVKHTGEAAGEIKKLGDYDAYFAYTKDKSTENAVLLLTDIIGHNFINVQLIADQLAANGFFTVVPDLFHGDAVPLNRPDGWDLQVWLQEHGPDKVEPVVETALKELKGHLGAKRVGAVGYCFGAKYVVRHLKEGELDAGFIAHPSFVTADELKKITKPLSIAAAETDSLFPAEKRNETEQILKDDLSVPYHFSLYSGVEHGFAVRGDPEKKQSKFAKEQAFIQAVTWFNEHVKA